MRYDADGCLEPVPGCKRAVLEAVNILSAKGHDIVHFQPPDLDAVQRDFFNFVLADLGRNNLVRWKGEILDQSIEVNNLVYKIPFFLRKSIFKFIFNLISPSMAHIADCSLNFSGDLWNGIRDAEDRKAKILKSWNDAGIDIVIGPGFGFPGNNLSSLRKSLWLITNKKIVS